MFFILIIDSIIVTIYKAFKRLPGGLRLEYKYEVFKRLLKQTGAYELDRCMGTILKGRGGEGPS